MCTLELFLSENVWSELSLYCDKVSPSVFSHRAACFVINLHIHSMTQHVDTIIEVAPLSCFCLLGFPSGGVQNGTNSGGHRLLSGPAGRPLLMPRGPPHTLWGRLLTHLYEEVPKPCPVSKVKPFPPFHFEFCKHLHWNWFSVFQGKLWFNREESYFCNK